MGAACGCMTKNKKGETVNSKGIVIKSGGTQLGGSEVDGDNVAAARAARFEKERENKKKEDRQYQSFD